MGCLDNIVCGGAGIISGGAVGALTDWAIQSSQKYSSLPIGSRISLDVLAGAVVLGVVTLGSYILRDILFYEIRKEDMSGNPSDFTKIIDKRTGKIVSFTADSDPNSYGHSYL